MVTASAAAAAAGLAPNHHVIWCAWFRTQGSLAHWILTLTKSTQRACLVKGSWNWKACGPCAQMPPLQPTLQRVSWQVMRRWSLAKKLLLGTSEYSVQPPVPDCIILVTAGLSICCPANRDLAILARMPWCRGTRKHCYHCLLPATVCPAFILVCSATIGELMIY